jgi:hypothetical protein
MNEPNVIALNPYILECLNYLQLPINTIDDVTGAKSNNEVPYYYLKSCETLYREPS